MSDDGFDEIIAGQPDGEDDDQELTNIWEALSHVWPHFYPGYLVKGVILAEYVDEEGDKVMRFITSPDVAPWELLGLLESARLDARSISADSTVSDPLAGDDEDD